MTGTAIPLSLRALPQWVVWRYEERSGKRTKVPYGAKASRGVLESASSTDPSTWTNYGTAVAFLESNTWADGIGIAIVRSNGITGVDLDHAVDEDGQIEPWALAIIRQLDSYTEVSPSTRGIRIFVGGVLPVDGRNSRTGIEMYCAGRYLTVTGNHVAGTPLTIEQRQDELTAIYAEVFPARAKANGNGRPATPLDLDDTEVIRRAMASRNGPVFSRLWNGDTTIHSGDDSSADLALCNHLAFWTGGNVEQMDRLFRNSGLMRPKWDERHFSTGETYGQRTIAVALEGRGPDDFYRGPGRTSDSPLPQSGEEQRSGPDQVGTEPSTINDSSSWPAPGSGWTDLGNAERFVKQHGANIRFVSRWEQWIVWNGQLWVRNDTRLVEQLAFKTVRSLYVEASQIDDPDRRKDAIKHAVRSEGAQRIKAMISLAESQPGVAITPEDLNRDRWLLNVQNGTLDLRTCVLREHRREDYITKICPVAYDGEATAPTWDRFLRRIMADRDDMITFVQRSAGYSLTGQTGEECLFFCYGTGRNGKSKFLGALQYVLGDYAKSTKPDVFMERKGQSGATNDLADLAGARFVPTIETGEGGRLAEALLKWVTGGDPIKARFLFQENFTFLPEFKLWLAGNHKPVIRGSDEGIWSRIRLVPFTVTIPPEERDKELAAKLEAEAVGILNWAVDGCVEWLIHGLGEPPEVIAATKEYREEMDVLSDFFDDCCLMRNDIRTRAKALFERYEQWAKANGMSPASSTWFGRKLGERGFKRIKSDGLAWWHGIGLLTSD